MSEGKIVSLFGENPLNTQDVSVEQTLSDAAKMGFEDVLVIGYAPVDGGHRLQYLASSMTKSDIVWILESVKYGLMQGEFS